MRKCFGNETTNCISDTLSTCFYVFSVEPRRRSGDTVVSGSVDLPPGVSGVGAVAAAAAGGVSYGSPVDGRSFTFGGGGGAASSATSTRFSIGSVQRQLSASYSPQSPYVALQVMVLKLVTGN